MASSTGSCGFPRLNAPFVNTEGRITQPWSRLLTSLWQKTGGASSPAISTYVQAIGGGNFAVFDAITGINLGIITTVSPSPGAAQPQVVAGSPYVFTSAGIGTLVVESGQVEVSRDGGASWLVFGLAGGACPVLAADKVRVTYYNVAPKVTFLPTLGL